MWTNTRNLSAKLCTFWHLTFSRPKRYAWILDKIHLCRNALLGPLSRVLLLLSSSERSSEIYSARIHRYQIPTPIKTCARQSTSWCGNTSHFGNDFGRRLELWRYIYLWWSKFCRLLAMNSGHSHSYPLGGSGSCYLDLRLRWPGKYVLWLLPPIRPWYLEHQFRLLNYQLNEQ